jgi:hypothetical protein
VPGGAPDRAGRVRGGQVRLTHAEAVQLHDAPDEKIEELGVVASARNGDRGFAENARLFLPVDFGLNRAENSHGGTSGLR